MLEREDRDGIAIVRLAHGKANALDAELLNGIVRTLETLRAAPPAALVLTGTGNSFSAGVDLFRVRDGGAPYTTALLDGLDATLLGLYTLPLPVVAAVNGHAIAGGCILAVAADRVLLAEGRAKLGVTEMKVGVPFPTLALEVFRARLVAAVAEDLVLSGRLVDPTEALRLGLVDELVPAERLVDRAVEVARGLAAAPRHAYADAKLALRQPVLDRVEATAARREAGVRRTWTEPATFEAIARFLAATVGAR